MTIRQPTHTIPTLNEHNRRQALAAIQAFETAWKTACDIIHHYDEQPTIS